MSSSLGFTWANTAPHQSCGVPLPSKAKMTSNGKCRPFLSNKFLENNLSAASTKQSRLPSREAVSIFPCAVLTTDSAFELWGKFNLDGQSEVQITSSNSESTIPFQITIQIINSSGSEVLHWGVITDQKKDWSFPSRLPDGTKLYKNSALRTPFIQSGQDSFIKIEVDEPEMKAIEFLILDEARNKWFKDNGRNFRITLPKKDENLTSSLRKDQSVSIPEDLVQIQAFLRWERKGKQNYTPSQEKEEFEAARTELLQESYRGLSIEELRAKLTKGTDDKPTKGTDDVKETLKPEIKIPTDLVQVQAYIRWEKAGKPTYSQEKQMVVSKTL